MDTLINFISQYFIFILLGIAVLIGARWFYLKKLDKGNQKLRFLLGLLKGYETENKLEYLMNPDMGIKLKVNLDTHEIEEYADNYQTDKINILDMSKEQLTYFVESRINPEYKNLNK